MVNLATCHMIPTLHPPLTDALKIPVFSPVFPFLSSSENENISEIPRGITSDVRHHKIILRSLILELEGALEIKSSGLSSFRCGQHDPGRTHCS